MGCARLTSRKRRSSFIETFITHARMENFMNRIFALVLLTLSAIASAQAPQIKSGATVYIEPMGGYEAYLAAAFVKRRVPLAIVTDKTKAAYIIKSTVSQNVPSTPQVVVNNSATATVNQGDNSNQAFNQGWQSGEEAAARRAARRAALGSTSVSISVIDVNSSQIVFASSADKGGTTDQVTKTADACAKNLKEFIERSEKAKK